MSSSYQPFPITEFKTGFYQYLEPWIRPQDAFEPLQDAFIYRGTLNKRPGYKVFGNTLSAGRGRMFYQDYLQPGNGGAGPYTQAGGAITTVPLVPGSVTMIAGVQSITDNGAGGWTGAVGTIDYTTGNYSITFPLVVGATTGIYAKYAFTISRDIMGLKTWINPANGTIKLLAFDTRRACVFDDGTEIFTPLTTVSEQIGIGTGGVGPYNFIAGFNRAAGAEMIARGTFGLTNGTETFTSNFASPGILTGSAGGAGTIDWTTGAFSVTFAAGTSATFTITYTLANDYFTGDYTNFFNAVNWKPGPTTSYLYCVNNIDKITLYDGTNLSRPPFSINNSDKINYVNNISTAIDLDIFKNRLLLHRPTVVGASNPEFQTIRFSAQFNATNLVTDVAGNGGALVFPTQDQIMVGEFLRDQMIVFMKNSAWIMQPTGFTNPPFRAIQVNGTRSTNCPYGAVPYDQRITSIGSKGIIACDGVNTQRFDVNIIDQFLDINPQAYNQCYSQRYDAINQTWTLYPELGFTRSNKVLVYNFLENTWSVYSLTSPMSCLGLYQVISDVTWASFADPGPNPTTWEEAQFSWKYYLNQKGSAQLLGGGQNGTVYVLNDDNSDTDNGTHYDCDIISTLWNPFTAQGSAVDFGYIDFYYSVDEQVTLLLTFYINGENDAVIQRNITLNPSNVATSQLTNFERVYLNFRAQFVQMEISTVSGSNGIFQIQGLILWAKPAGRLQPGYNLI